MAKKKGGFGRFLGAITGSPYEKMLKQVDKLVDQYGEEEAELASQLEALVDQAGDLFEAEDIELLFRHAQGGAAIVTGEREVRFDPWYRKVVTGSLPLALKAAFKENAATSTARSGCIGPMSFPPFLIKSRPTRSPHMC